MNESQHNRGITKNIAWNFVGIGIPLVLALITISQQITLGVLGTISDAPLSP
jgi:hypothetical protein